MSAHAKLSTDRMPEFTSQLAVPTAAAVKNDPKANKPYMQSRIIEIDSDISSSDGSDSVGSIGKVSSCSGNCSRNSKKTYMSAAAKAKICNHYQRKCRVKCEDC